jgi:hypothetical protein
MSKKPSYERYAWFHGRVKAGAFPAGLPPLKRYLRRNFGVNAGDRSTEVRCAFTPPSLPGSPSRNGTRPRRSLWRRTAACGSPSPSPASRR